MSNLLHLLRFKQQKVFKKLTAHWGILLTEIIPDSSSDFYDRATLFHISRNEEGKPANFECTSADLSRWEKSKIVIDRVFVGTTEHTRDEIEKVCRKVAIDFLFDKFDHNCQNYVDECLKQIGLDCPITPSNECGCISLVKISVDEVSQPVS